MAAEMERDLIRERTLDGLRAAQARGRRGGRPAAVNDDILAIARARGERGEPVTAIARHLHIGRSTLYRALEAGQDAAAGQATGGGPVTAPRGHEPGTSGQQSGPGQRLMPGPEGSAAFRIETIVERC